jgi:hypothetical protein
VSGALQQLDALVRAFFARFFESEITSATDGLKGPFFWLLATLAVPGLFIPWIMAFEWQLLGRMEGPEAVRVASVAEKTFYLGFSMMASGVVTVIAWGSLLPDKRDTLILGSLPVKPSLVVSAKLLALAGYVGFVALFMQGVAAVFWGMILGDSATLGFAVRGIWAHLIACSLASMAVCIAVAAAQGMLLSIAGPRLFRPISTILQAVLVGTMALCLALLPVMTSSIVATLSGAAGAKPWLFVMPPVWFLGIYERLLGTSNPTLISLASRGWTAFGAAVVLVVITYPIAYRRLMVSVIETGSEPRHRLARLVHGLVVRFAGRDSSARAAAEFFSATLARVDRQRFVTAIALGVAIAWGLPGWMGFQPSADPQPGVLALPLAAMMFLLVGLRVAASLPADVRASWVFQVHDISRRSARQGLERVMFLLAVLPPVLLSTLVLGYLWGGPVAVTHGVIMAGVGVVLLELLIWHCDEMPCGQQWTPARADFGRRWPLHFAVFLIVVSALPKLEVLLFAHPYAAAGFVVYLLAVAAGVRYVSARHQIIPIYEEVDPVAGVLRLQ